MPVALGQRKDAAEQGVQADEARLELERGMAVGRSPAIPLSSSTDLAVRAPRSLTPVFDGRTRGSMATDEYWAKQREYVLNEQFGPRSRQPMSDEALTAFGPPSAVGDALCCLVLGMRDRADECLAFIPRLQERLAGSDGLRDLPGLRAHEAAGHLRQALHVGVWLRDGTVNAGLAREAYLVLLELNRSWGARFTAPNLLDLMLLCIEAGDGATASTLYREHERKPMQLPPKDLRFSGNARAVLYACTEGHGHVARDLLQEAVDKFRARASRWERSVTPIPYLMPVDLARTLRACNRALGLTHDLDSVVALVR